MLRITRPLALTLTLTVLTLGGCAAKIARTPEEALELERLTNVEIHPAENPGCTAGFYEYSATQSDGDDVCGDVCCEDEEGCQVSFGSCIVNPFSGIADGTKSVP